MSLDFLSILHSNRIKLGAFNKEAKGQKTKVSWRVVPRAAPFGTAFDTSLNTLGSST